MQREVNLTDHATGTVDEREEDKTEEYAVRNRSQPAKNRVDHTTGELDIIFGGSNGWGNDSAPPSAPHILGIPGGAGVTMKQQNTEFLMEGYAPATGTAQNLHREIMGGTTMLQNTRLGGNIMG